MDRQKIEQDFLNYCIEKGKGKLPIALDLLELITEFIEIDRNKQLLLCGVSNWAVLKTKISWINLKT